MQLTHSASNGLGGNARTALICAASPAEKSVAQTYSTLTFDGADFDGNVANSGSSDGGKTTDRIGEGPGEVPQYGDTFGVVLENVRIQFTYRISKFLLTKWMVWG